VNEKSLFTGKTMLPEYSAAVICSSVVLRVGLTGHSFALTAVPSPPRMRPVRGWSRTRREAWRLLDAASKQADGLTGILECGCTATGQSHHLYDEDQWPGAVCGVNPHVYLLVGTPLFHAPTSRISEYGRTSASIENGIAGQWVIGQSNQNFGAVGATGGSSVWRGQFK
jgi:hypothetical protein